MALGLPQGLLTTSLAHAHFSNFSLSFSAPCGCRPSLFSLLLSPSPAPASALTRPPSPPFPHLHTAEFPFLLYRALRRPSPVHQLTRLPCICWKSRFTSLFSGRTRPPVDATAVIPPGWRSNSKNSDSGGTIASVLAHPAFFLHVLLYLLYYEQLNKQTNIDAESEIP
jgi:hypothetical protein